MAPGAKIRRGHHNYWYNIQASILDTQTMAKGNDGNFLQHSVEVAAADRLAAENPNALHIALTHGMAPFEHLEHNRKTEARRLKAALALASQAQQKNEPLIVTAYRKTEASDAHYPNSAELLRSIRGGNDGSGLSGGITETCPVKHKELAEAWAGSSVKVECKSWRSQVCRGGVLACPGNLQVPWLFTMDPMTYRHEAASDGCNPADDDKLHDSDFCLLSNTLAPFVESGQPGIAALFVYNVRAERKDRFWNSSKALAKSLGTGHCCYSITHLTHRGGKKNLAALLYSSIDIPSDFIQNAVEDIESVALAAAMQASRREFSTRKAVMDILEGPGGDAVSAQFRA